MHVKTDYFISTLVPNLKYVKPGVASILLWGFSDLFSVLFYLFIHFV